MKKLFAAILIALTASCASMSDLSPKAAIAASYATVEVLVDQTTGAVVRGRMSREQGSKIVIKAKKAVDTIAKAEDALKVCGVEVKNCDSVTKILDQIQPLLLEMERDLRAKEKQ